jgi:hypothetical protein
LDINSSLYKHGSGDESQFLLTCLRFIVFIYKRSGRSQVSMLHDLENWSMLSSESEQNYVADVSGRKNWDCYVKFSLT